MFRLGPPPSLLILYPLFKNDQKEVLDAKNKSRNRQKLNDSFAGDNLSDQDADIILPNANPNPSPHPIPLASVHQANKVKETAPIAGLKLKIGKFWPIPCWSMILGWQ
jgi:hypothetical protein